MASKKVQGQTFKEDQCHALKEIEDEVSQEIQGQMSKTVKGQSSEEVQGQSSEEVQGQASEQSAQNYWFQCTKSWYPELHTQTYFLPPLHFNRVPYSVENIAGQQVLVAQIPQDGPSQTESTTKSRSRKRKSQTMSSSARNLSGQVINRRHTNLNLQPVYDSDVRDNRALERVLYCLRALVDNSQPKEVMMVISQLQFGKYLGEPSYAATAALLPRPNTLPEHFLQQHYHEGDFDVLIIHRQYGLFTLEIKSVGENFSMLKMTEKQADDVVMKKVKEALKQLSKSEVVLKHLTSDLMDNNITKILAMPNISSTQLLRAISRNPSDGQDLCQCLGVRSVDDALKLCLLSDQLSSKQTASDVNHIVLKDLGVWWQQLVKTSGAQPSITEMVYEQLVARFCGPATTVEVHCVTAPRLNIRILGEAVSATGEIMARLVLFPQQVELLDRSPPRVFLIGPPGTGKTIVLIIQGLTWLRLGNEVHVVSSWSESLAATIAIEHQLKETMKTTASSRVHRHQFDFEKGREVNTAVRRLKSLSEGRQLCVIADEAFNYRKFTEFCDQLIVQVPKVYLWGASVHHEDRPLCLEEVKLTMPLRSPPVVVREVMEAKEIKKYKQVHDYTISDVPVPTDGPAVIRFTHRDGQSGHTEYWPRDCVECGHQVARVLTELNIGRTGNSSGPPPLQYRDVLVLCDGYPTDGYPTGDRVNNNDLELSDDHHTDQRVDNNVPNLLQYINDLELRDDHHTDERVDNNDPDLLQFMFDLELSDDHHTDQRVDNNGPNLQQYINDLELRDDYSNDDRVGNSSPLLLQYINDLELRDYRVGNSSPPLLQYINGLELRYDRVGNSSPPLLQYLSDQGLSCESSTDDEVDNNSHSLLQLLNLSDGSLNDSYSRSDNSSEVLKTASGLVLGLRECHVPVRVVEKGDEDGIRDTALGVGDLVTVTNWRDIHGLERKVVVVEKRDVDWSERLHAMSRCTSQLVLID